MQGSRKQPKIDLRVSVMTTVAMTHNVDGGARVCGLHLLLVGAAARERDERLEGCAAATPDAAAA